MSDSKKQWRLARNHKIVALYESGKSLGEIGEIYGISRERVRQILEQIGLPRRKNTISEKSRLSRKKKPKIIPKELLVELYVEKGFGFQKIQKLLKICYQTLIRNFEYHGIERRSNAEILRLQSELPKLRSQTLYILYFEQKLTSTEIAGRFGFTEQEIAEKRQKLALDKFRKS